MKCKMCFSEITDGNCNCSRPGYGPCHTHYDEVVRINHAIRGRLYELKDHWLYSDKLHVCVESFLSSAFELTDNIRKAAMKGKDYGNSEE